MPVTAAPVTDEAIREWEPLMHGVIHRMRHAGNLREYVETDDAVQVARIAVWRALTAYEPAAGRTFALYAGVKIAQALLDHQRSVSRPTGWHRHDGQIASIDSLSTYAYSASGDGDDATVGDMAADPAVFDDHVEQRDRLRRAFETAHTFKPRDLRCFQIIANGGSQADVARALNITDSGACLMRKRVARKLNDAQAAVA